MVDLSEAGEKVRAKQVSPVELTEACLDRIERLNPALNAFVTVTRTSALEEARAAQAEIAAGKWRGPLHGIPIALKDLIDVKGVPTTAASRLFADRIAEKDAHVTALLREAGAVFLGKLNMHELAFGASSLISASGPVVNPWSPTVTAGGSSSGSTVAVAAELCYGAVGTDTGGSIRQPAAFCSVVGLKPTFGLVSTEGVIPLSVSNDHVGPITRSALDAALLLQGMVDGGRDYAAESATTGPVRIGMPKTHYFSDINPEIGTAIEAAVAALGDLSARRVQVEVPAHLDTTAFRADIWAYHRDHVRRSPELYHPDTLARIKSGAEVDKGAQRNARAVLDGLRATAGKIFDQVDVLVTPTSGVPPFGVMRDWSPEQLRAVELFTLRNTRPFNALGLPAMSVPCGFTSEGLPIGMQIVGPPGGEARVLAVARAFQQRTDWHKRRPPV